MRFGDFAALPIVSRLLVAIGWLGFFVFFFFMQKQTGLPEAKRDRSSLIGIALQGLAYGVVWALQRPLPHASAPLAPAEVVFDVLGPILSVIAAWFGLTAVRTLGRQWSYTARLVEGHELVTEGPYQLVRHPIYTGMLGKLLATACSFGHWLGVLIAVPLFLLGTMIRVRSEEKLLRGQFGPAYDEYAKRVRGLVPWVF